MNALLQVMVVGNDLDERVTRQRANSTAEVILKAHYYFLVVDHFNRLENKIKQFKKLMSWSSRGLLVLYTTDMSLPSNFETAKGFLDMLWQYKMFNTLVMIPSRTNYLVNEIYTGFLYKDSCFGITTEWIGDLVFTFQKYNNYIYIPWYIKNVLKQVF